MWEMRNAANNSFHLLQITVVDSTTGNNYQFPGRQWLDKNRGDKKLSRVFAEGIVLAVLRAFAQFIKRNV